MASEAISKYINSDFSRARCVAKTYEVSFSTNPGFTDLIEWYSLYFGSVLTCKFKMVVQNGCRRHIENQKKWRLLIQIGQKGSEVSFPVNSGITHVMEWF